MRAVVQRVSEAAVEIEGELYNSIKQGLLILLGIEKGDSREDSHWLARKIGSLRIFSDNEGLMNYSINETGGEALVISQFTLHAKTKKGTRPSFIRAANPEDAIPLYKDFIEALRLEVSGNVKSGLFGADMKVSLINDGPVTLIIDTANKE